MKKTLSFVFALIMLVTAVYAAPAVSAAPATGTDTPKGYNLVYTGSLGNGDVDIDTTKIDFDVLGENLIPDPAVSAFDGEGNYLNYYDPSKFGTGYNTPAIVNSEAWWDKPIIKYNGFIMPNPEKMWTSPAYSGYALNDPSLSHTPDGTGVIRVTGTRKSQSLPLPALERYSYYMITFWIKSSAQDSGKNINILRVPNDDQGNIYSESHTNGYMTRLNYTAYATSSGRSVGKWYRCTFMVYTGNVAWDQPAISIPGGTTASVKYYFDDFGVYKIRDSYGDAIAANRADAVNMKDYYSDILDSAPYGGTRACAALNSGSYKMAYETIDWSKYGVNVLHDSTVSRFNNGVYETYSATNPNAWWDKPVMNGTDDLIYKSMNYRGFVTNDTSYSHTDDGSGAINLTNDNVYLVLPLSERFHFYVITLWVKDETPNENATIELHRSYNGTFATGGDVCLVSCASALAGGNWIKVTFVAYTSNMNTLEAYPPFLKLYKLNSATIDDINVWKITDPDLARVWIDNGKFVLRGDINQNFTVNTADINLFIREIMNDEYAFEWSSDANGDGSADVRDLVKIKKMCIDE